MCVLVQECVSALLSFPGVYDAPDREGRTALMWAAQRGNHSVLKAMLERDVDVHATDTLGATGEWGAGGSQWCCSVMCPFPSPALHAAALSGHTSCVQVLLQVGSEVTQCNSQLRMYRLSTTGTACLYAQYYSPCTN